MNRLSQYWGDEERQERERSRQDVIARERRLGAVLFLGLLSAFPLIMLACSDRSGEELARDDSTPAPVARPATDTREPVATPASDEIPTAESTIALAPVSDRFDDGHAAFVDGDYGDAIEIFHAYTDRVPNNPWGHYMTGLTAHRLGDYSEAEQAYERALGLDPEHVKSLLNLGRTLLEQDRADEAREYIGRALDLEPESVDGYRLLGRAQHELGLTDLAIESFQQAILLDEGDAWSMNNLAFIHIERERFDKALPPLARATQLRDDVALFQNNLGVVLERLGHLAGAEDAFRTALELDGGYEKASVSLARVAERDSTLVDTIDLELYALQFTEEIESWREPFAIDAVEPSAITDEESAPEQDEPVGVSKEPAGTTEPDTLTTSDWELMQLMEDLR